MIDPEKSVIVICCEAMKQNLTDRTSCMPQIRNAWPPYFEACDAWLDDFPIFHCPWCGKKIEKKP